jgi:hypothetical protein
MFNNKWEWYKEAKLLHNSGLKLFFKKKPSSVGISDYIVLYAGKNDRDKNPTEITWWKEHECPIDFGWIERL